MSYYKNLQALNEQAQWQCPNCETVNTEDVCVACGNPRRDKMKAQRAAWSASHIWYIVIGVVVVVQAIVFAVYAPQLFHGVPQLTASKANPASSENNGFALTTSPELIGFAVFGDYEYSMYSDNTATITGWNGSDAELTIPKELDGYRVIGIGEHAFSGRHFLTDISIPDGVTSIGNEAFYRCEGLMSISIPNSVTIIDDYAFTRCYSLIIISIPDSVTSIGDYAFNCCYCLASINIPDSVTSIGDYAFHFCSLTSINIPDSVTGIGTGAFENCDSLTIYASTGSYAETYAKENDIPCRPS